MNPGGLYDLVGCGGPGGSISGGSINPLLLCPGHKKDFSHQQLVGERVSSSNAVVGGRRVDTDIAVELVE